MSRSSAEAKYRAHASTAAELSWLLVLLRELNVCVTQGPALWCVNISATYIVANPFFYAHTKHIDLDYHFIRDRIARSCLHVRYVSTKDQIADLFTKGLSRSQHAHFMSKLTLTP